MSLAVSSPANNQSDLDSLQSAQRAPEFLRQQVERYSAYPIPFVTATESSELWASYEKLIYSCLRIGDDKSAQLCLERLTARFGASNERVMGLRGLYQEAVAGDDAAFKAIYAEYGRILTDDPTNMPVMKRRIVLLQSLGMQSEAIEALVELLQISPTDAEAWTELSGLYLTQAMYAQASYCLEEVLLLYPNAWNSTDRFLETCYQDNKTNSRVMKDNGSSTRLALDVVKELNKKATEELQKIVKQTSIGLKRYSNHEESEIISAKALLDQSSS
ncbi:hypothetical protein MMC11_008399 [Xylographa trunciseda]|nr:hypothetical protein [Xylographa trunciseda]